jgi:hypothetical protein
MRRIKSALEIQHQRLLTYEELGRMCGQGHSAVGEKLSRAHQPQVEALLAWVERLAPEARSQCIETACRVYPTLAHPRIAHDPTSASRLKGLLWKTSGLTAIQGGDSAGRTFLATALGHSFAILRRKSRVLGIDAHEPDWFVPLQDVIYISRGIQGVSREAVLRVWTGLARTNGGVIVLNGVWPFLAHLETQVSQAASRTHVILADGLGFDRAMLQTRTHSPVHILRLRGCNRDQLTIEVV